MQVDVVIIGAGPSGLCLARALSGCGLSIAVLERQQEAALENPAFDGREIALTHLSARLLRELGLWERIHPSDISPLRNARVFNGTSLLAMSIDHRDGEQDELGYLISNALIRKAAYGSVKASPDIALLTGVEISDIRTNKQAAFISLADGRTIEARLAIAADSRFSESRRRMGIPASTHDFGKSMMVCAMEHEVPHQHTAWEWFDYGQTLALLPMNGMRSSVVVTLPPGEIQQLLTMPEEAFNRAVETRFKHRLGKMRLVSTRHAYPLVTVYADRFVGERFALTGDAAVGMHPVTAHGFNFGLRGADMLASEIRTAHARGADIATPALLARYEQKHRFATRPLFLATHAIAKLFGNDTPPARLLRHASLRLGDSIGPFKRTVAHMLTDATR
jgi:ubiquinone biosynthesis UbiH/UbiF/VisC/COQ6 family hydroxylase